MNPTIKKLLLAMVVISIFSFATSKKSKSVLVFSKTNGFRHSSIPAGINAIKVLGSENRFSVDATEDSLAFTEANLAKYDAVIFLSPTGNVLGEAEQRAFENYIKKGGGFVGVHAATDCEYDWPWYVKLVGASFLSHPAQQMAKLVVKDKKHRATKHLPDVWERKDEWYNFKSINPDVKLLLTLDETSYTGGKNGDVHPMSWYHQYDGGRAFYTGLGHTAESYGEDAFLRHLLGGIKYAMKN
ncbi:MAG: ThuA domain-containing protein [Bacteroidota bacterium]|nr:ThuA domain-containing protein [Ferruginibacter sp.]